MKNFSIYRASAGSGKTYLLTYNYIKLALQQPDNFKSILAVTFTNKAMEEMKSRIIDTLQALAKGGHAMSADLMADLEIDEQLLRKRSADLVTSILHNYSFFAVSTIDTFFQKVVRSFAREMGIHSGFKIELDQTKVISDVIDQLIFEMGEDKQLVSWLTDFAIHQINAGKNWDTKRQIKSLSGELFKEEVVLRKQEIFAKLSDPEFMPSFVKMVFNKKETFEEEIVRLGNLAWQKISDHGLTVEDFTQKGRGVAGYVLKSSSGEVSAPNSYVMAALEEGKWASAKSPTYATVESALSSGLDLAVANIITFYQENIAAYNTVNQVANYLYTFGLLSRISEALQQYKQENELMLISDFPMFLNEIINDSDSPFVYEKIGNRYKHYLIDEFQDTSGLQWNNFKPLIRDSISEGHMNMVVGDIKQSIYRWRGGNWKILLDQIKKDIGEEYSREETLITNRRSKQAVVEFNNHVFSKLPAILENSLLSKTTDLASELKIKAAYETAVQNAYDQSSEGLVDIAFIDKKETEEPDELIFERLIQNIQMLQNHNYELSDIAILVRTNVEGRKITQALIDHQRANPNDKYRYDVISNESLFIRNNKAVNVILQGLSLSVDPSEDLNVEQLKYAYGEHYKDDSDTNQITDFISLLEQSGGQTLTSAVDLIMNHFNLFSIQKDVPYVMAFQDTVIDYLQYSPDSISEFLIWWEDHKDRSIQVSGDQNAMTLMTIHKSKGLQFKAVMIPFCHWSMDHSGGFRDQMLWCETGESADLNALPMLPLKYSSALMDTIFKKDYLTEKSDVFLDNLNLLYVAMTRAEEVLFVTSAFASKKMPGIGTVADLLLEFTDQENLTLSDDEEWKHLRMGQISEYSTYKPTETETIQVRAIQSTTSRVDRLSFRSSNHILDEEQQRSIDHGDIVHWVFSRISVKKDFHQALDQAVIKFALSQKELGEIKLLLRQVWELPQVAEWFADEWKVKNESSILLENGKIKRPDRVVFKGDSALVIDYKTGKESKSHLNQVEGYKQLLLRMGFKNVKGYLLYLSSQQVLNV